MYFGVTPNNNFRDVICNVLQSDDLCEGAAKQWSVCIQLAPEDKERPVCRVGATQKRYRQCLHQSDDSHGSDER